MNEFIALALKDRSWGVVTLDRHSNELQVHFCGLSIPSGFLSVCSEVLVNMILPCYECVISKSDIDVFRSSLQLTGKISSYSIMLRSTAP